MKYRVEYWTLSDGSTFIDVDASDEVAAVEEAMRLDEVFCQLKQVTRLPDEYEAGDE